MEKYKRENYLRRIRGFYVVKHFFYNILFFSPIRQHAILDLLHPVTFSKIATKNTLSQYEPKKN